MRCDSCKYWNRNGKKNIGSCGLLQSNNVGIKAYLYKNRKDVCKVFDTKDDFGCVNYIFKSGYLIPFEVHYFNDIISNNKSDYCKSKIVMAVDELEAIKKVASELLGEIRIIDLMGDKKFIIATLKQIGFNYRNIKQI